MGRQLGHDPREAPFACPQPSGATTATARRPAAQFREPSCKVRRDSRRSRFQRAFVARTGRRSEAAPGRPRRGRGSAHPTLTRLATGRYQTPEMREKARACKTTSRPRPRRCFTHSLARWRPKPSLCSRLQSPPPCRLNRSESCSYAVFAYHSLCPHNAADVAAP
jgi:hypothetical protein